MKKQFMWKVMFKVILSSIFPSILAEGAFVFVSSIKEPPVTLLLRSPGYDTMAIEFGWKQVKHYTI